jgi:AcrR family transcriptional regulator
MPKAFSEREKIWIKERLLEQGSLYFSQYGLKKTSVEELARAAGISKAAFYLFYQSKEALFMDVAERAEEHFRREVLAMIELPGPSPRARLVAVFQKAFTLWKTVPILQFFTRSDYNQLTRRMPAEKIHEHLASDEKFIAELVARCRQAGIPIQAQAEQISSLMYALFFTVLHRDDLGPGRLQPAVDLLLELVAAFCLGEVAGEVAGEAAHQNRLVQAQNK